MKIFCPAIHSHFASASMCPGKMIGVKKASRRPTPHPIKFTLMGQTKSKFFAFSMYTSHQ